MRLNAATLAGAALGASSSASPPRSPRPRRSRTRPLPPPRRRRSRRPSPPRRLRKRVEGPAEILRPLPRPRPQGGPARRPAPALRQPLPARLRERPAWECGALPRSGVKLVLFDVDGTLVDSQRIIVAAQRAAFAALGLDRRAGSARCRWSASRSSRPSASSSGRTGPRPASRRPTARPFRPCAPIRRTRSRSFPACGELLDRLAARDDLVLGIATGKSRRGVRHIVERHGWEGRFATIQTADDAPSKPHPAMILQAMADVGAAPEETVMVGDSTFDMAMAPCRRHPPARGRLGLSSRRRAARGRRRGDRRGRGRSRGGARPRPLPLAGARRHAHLRRMSDPFSRDWFRDAGEPDPMRAAQAGMRTPLPKRFYERAAPRRATACSSSSSTAARPTPRGAGRSRCRPAASPRRWPPNGQGRGRDRPCRDAGHPPRQFRPRRRRRTRGGGARRHRALRRLRPRLLPGERARQSRRRRRTTPGIRCSTGPAMRSAPASSLAEGVMQSTSRRKRWRPFGPRSRR